MAANTKRPTPANLFSYSRVKTFYQCPLRYKYRYLKGLAESFRSIESYLGNVVHEVLEWMYSERQASREPTLEQVIDELERHWTRSWGLEIAVVRVGDEPGTYLRLGEEMLRSFHAGAFEVDSSTTIALEKRVSRPLSPDVVMTGIIDRLGRHNGRLFVVDYKTSRTVGDPSDFSEGLQAPLYAACVLEDFGVPEVLAGYHYLRDGTTRWLKVDRQRATERLERFLALAEEVLQATVFDARPGPLCPWCGFNARCPSAEVRDELAGGLRLHSD